MSRNPKVYGTLLRNALLYRRFQEIGYDYILNPDSGELHIVDPAKFQGSHNLVNANLENFIGLCNLYTAVPAHLLRDGTELPVYDSDTDELIGTYRLNKCEHCFPQLSKLFPRLNQ